MDMLMEYMARGFMVMLMISMPCVLVAAGIGLVVGILQAVTQVQEQTIAAAPKILAVFLVIIIGGVGYTRILTNLVEDGFSMAFNVVPKNDQYVLSENYYKYTKPFAGEMKDKINTPGDVKNAMKNAGKIPFTSKDSKIIYQATPKQNSAQPSLLETQKIMGR